MYNNYPLACVINEESINMRLYQTSIRFCLQNKEEDSNQSRTWKEEILFLYYCGCGVYGLNFGIEKAGLSRGSRDQH